jgi:hypothetical protein
MPGVFDELSVGQMPPTTVPPTVSPYLIPGPVGEAP